MGLTVAEALDRIYAAGVSLRVDGANLKASGTPLNERQRIWLREHKIAVISEIETPSRCSCGQSVAQYGEYDGQLLPYCEEHIPDEERAATWPGIGVAVA